MLRRNKNKLLDLRSSAQHVQNYLQKKKLMQIKCTGSWLVCKVNLAQTPTITDVSVCLYHDLGSFFVFYIPMMQTNQDICDDRWRFVDSFSAVYWLSTEVWSLTYLKVGCHLGWYFAVCCPPRGGRGRKITKRTMGPLK
jgi:hypothetical protein